MDIQIRKTEGFRYVSGKVMTVVRLSKKKFFVSMYYLYFLIEFIFGDKALSESAIKENCLGTGTCFGDFFVYIEGVSGENTERIGYFSCALYDFSTQPVDLQHYQSQDNYLLYETAMIFVDDVSLAQRVRPEFVPPHDVTGRSQFLAIYSGYADGVEYNSQVILVDRTQVCPTPNCYLQASIQFLQALHNVEILPLADNHQNRNPQCIERLKY